MTSSQAIAYAIVAMERLGYSFEDIRKTRKEMENVFELCDEDRIESYAAHIMTELLSTKLFDVKIHTTTEIIE